MKYALQQQFIYGWDYVGSDGEGNRLLFDTREEAQADLDSDMKELMKMGYSPEDWQVVEYDPAKDTLNDLR